MLARLSLLTLAMIGVAGVADAATITRPSANMQPIVDKGMPGARVIQN
jgi:hypothetical protein